MQKARMTMIPHNRPTIGNEEINASTRVLSSGWIAQGEEVAALEAEIGVFINLPAENVVAVSSGSSALYLALSIANAVDKKISAPAYSCRSVWNAIQMARGLAVFRDNSPLWPNAPIVNKNEHIDISIVTHMFGIPDESVLTHDCPSFIIEDAAQAIGAKINNQSVGIFGNIGIFSLGATKPITSGGQGGILVSRNKELASIARSIRDYDSIMDNSSFKFNFQMTDIQAAIARVQLTRLPYFIHRREEIFQKYISSGLSLIDGKNEHISPIRYRAVILNTHESISKCRSELLLHGIKSIIPIEKSELLSLGLSTPNAVALTKKSLSIPLYPSLTDHEVDKIINICCKALKI